MTVLGFVLVWMLLVVGGVHAETCGDSDGNGTVSVTDGVNVLRVAAGLSSACANAGSRCDVDGSGSVSVSDGVNVLRHAAGLGATLACPVESVERFAGRYQGTFSGDDQGTFDVDVDCDGDIDGTGYSSFYDEEFDIGGTVTPAGALTFTIGGTSSGSRFEGTVDEDGRVSGDWSNRFEGSNGRFQGSRTNPRSCS